MSTTTTAVELHTKKSLLDSDSESDNEDNNNNNNSKKGTRRNAAASSEEEKSVRFSINTKYAQEYQSRKQREELQSEREEQKKRRGSSSTDREEEDASDDDDGGSSSSSEEDEDAALLTPQLDVDILKTINALRTKDQRIYDRNQRFFTASDEEEDDEEEEEDKDKDTDSEGDGKDTTNRDDGNQKMKNKPMRPKDVIREQILEQIQEEEGKQNNIKEATDSHDEKTTRLAYDEQQKELRKAFLEKDKIKNENSGDDGYDDDDNDDDFLVIKKRHKNDDLSEMDEQTKKQFEEEWKRMEETVLHNDKGAPKNSSLVDPRGEVQDGEKFLWDYIKNKSWVDKAEDGDVIVNSEDDDSDDDSLEQLEKTDEFEHQYNFRFEDAIKNAESTSGAEHSVMGYARSQTMNTLRRKDETRREKRLAREERKAAERKAKEEKLRRLKNAKREEMERKLKEVKAVLGAKEGRDPEKAEGGLENAPVDEAAILKLLEGDYDPEKFEKSMQEAFGNDFYSKEETEWKTDEDVEKTLKRDGDVEFYDDEDDEGEEADREEAHDGDEDEFDDGMDEEEREKETELEKTLRAKMEDKLYELDYEDIVAGMPTRFKYRQVEPNNYGLTTEEILLARDDTLKQYVSLKKMAPYREGDEYKVSGRKRRKFRQMMEQDIEELNHKLKEQGITVNDNQGEDQAGPEGSRKKRKRRRLKSGSKESKGSNTSQGEVIESPESKGENQEAAGETGEPKKSKRRRKKKGKKVGPSGGLDNKDASDHDERDGETSGRRVTKTTESRATDNPSRKSEKIKPSAKSEVIKDQKRKKKKKKKEKDVAVDGVSASRLASYGL